MLIKLVLSILLLIILSYFLANINKTSTRAWKKIALIGLFLLGIATIISPTLIDGLAKFMGIGRGTDLLLYGTVVVFIFTTINVYIKYKKLENLQGKIISKIALDEEKNNR